MLSRRVGEMHKILMLPDLASDGGRVSYRRPATARDDHFARPRTRW